MVSSLIFQTFSGEGLTEPPPQTPPPDFSWAPPLVRASLSILGHFAPSTRVSPSILGRFAPSIRASPSILGALRALDSGFALDTRALRALDLGFALNFQLGTLVWPPKIISWIRPCDKSSTRRPKWNGRSALILSDIQCCMCNIIYSTPSPKYYCFSNLYPRIHIIGHIEQYYKRPLGRVPSNGGES